MADRFVPKPHAAGAARFSRHVRALFLAALGAMAVSCVARDAVDVRLQALPHSAVNDLRIGLRGQIAGPTAGLRYKWFAVAGQCDPQTSDTATTEFSFADGSTKDRVTLQVWRGDRQVGQAEMDLKLDEGRYQRVLAARPHMEIAVTEIPPYQPNGGSNTRAQMSGRVTGNRAGDVLILYARADVWYRQPTPDAQIPIHPDGSWTTWTHTGGSYAVLLVRQDVDFFGRLDVLPPAGGMVLARTIVEGARH